MSHRPHPAPSARFNRRHQNTLAVEPSAVFFIHPFHLHDRDHCRRRRHRRSDDSLRVVGGMSNLFAPDMPCIKKPTNVKVGDTRAYLHTLRAKY